MSALGKWLVQLPRGHKVIQADGKMGRHPASLNGAEQGNQKPERFCFFPRALQESDQGCVPFVWICSSAGYQLSKHSSEGGFCSILGCLPIDLLPMGLWGCLLQLEDGLEDVSPRNGHTAARGTQGTSQDGVSSSYYFLWVSHQGCPVCY